MSDYKRRVGGEKSGEGKERMSFERARERESIDLSPRLTFLFFSTHFFFFFLLLNKTFKTTAARSEPRPWPTRTSS